MTRTLVLVGVLGVGSCTFGVQTFQGHSKNQALTLAQPDPDPPIAGNADLSSRRRDLDLGFLLAKDTYVLDLGVTFGLSAAHTTQVTGDLAMLPPAPRDEDFYDAYFSSLMIPVTKLEGLGIGVYGKVGATGFARTIRTSSGPDYHVEAGIELNLLVNHENWVFLRIGGEYESADVSIERTDGEAATGSTSFTGLTSAIGFRLGDP